MPGIPSKDDSFVWGTPRNYALTMFQVFIVMVYDDEEKIHKTNGVNISKFQEQEIRIAKRLEPLIWNPAPIERKYINLINN